VDKIYYYYYYCSKDLSMAMPCLGHEHFVAVRVWNLGIVRVQVILPTGHIYKIFDEDRQSTILVIALRLGVSLTHTSSF